MKNNQEQRRGQLTERIKEKSVELLGYEMDTKELRLMPHIMYVMVNEQKIEPSRVNEDDRKILSKWRKHGLIEGGASGLAITKDFWDILCEIVFLGYVDVD